jgi:hypothetical protein
VWSDFTLNIGSTQGFQQPVYIYIYISADVLSIGDKQCGAKYKKLVFRYLSGPSCLQNMLRVVFTKWSELTRMAIDRKFLRKLINLNEINGALVKLRIWQRKLIEIAREYTEP